MSYNKMPRKTIESIVWQLICYRHEISIFCNKFRLNIFCVFFHFKLIFMIEPTLHINSNVYLNSIIYLSLIKKHRVLRLFYESYGFWLFLHIRLDLQFPTLVSLSDGRLGGRWSPTILDVFISIWPIEPS